MKLFTETLKRVFLRKRTLLLLLAVVGEGCLLIAKNSTYFAEEIFAKHLYKWFAIGYSSITGLFPFSFAEILIILAPFLLIALIAGFIVKLVKNRKDFLYWILTFLLNAACIGSVIWFFYSFGYGTCYYRYPVSEYFCLETRPSSAEELADLLAELLDNVEEERAQLTSFDENGVYLLPYSTRELGRVARKAYVDFAEVYPLFKGHYPAPKPVIFSHLMSYTEIIGIYTCWTMEANVDVDITGYEIGSTMCHELSHLRGFMREEEANFLSYMVCMNSESHDLRYSGLMLALSYTMNALAGKNMDLYLETVSEHYVPGIFTDFRAQSEYWDQFKKAEIVAEVTNELNDNYLKANDQEDGVESYGRVVDLLLAKYRKDHGLD
ncbi:MAG: DUF3810 domain-containing protein [Lachnospiraceae bacterium]|nr:DUF3810 domain-containing protein [Lachnospiraceae bacterium]